MWQAKKKKKKRLGRIVHYLTQEISSMFCSGAGDKQVLTLFSRVSLLPETHNCFMTKGESWSGPTRAETGMRIPQGTRANLTLGKMDVGGKDLENTAGEGGARVRTLSWGPHRGRLHIQLPTKEVSDIQAPLCSSWDTQPATAHSGFSAG